MKTEAPPINGKFLRHILHCPPEGHQWHGAPAAHGGSASWVHTQIIVLGVCFQEKLSKSSAVNSVCHLYSSGPSLLWCLPWSPIKSHLFLHVTTMWYKPPTKHMLSVFLSYCAVCCSHSYCLARYLAYSSIGEMLDISTAHCVISYLGTPQRTKYHDPWAPQSFPGLLPFIVLTSIALCFNCCLRGEISGFL